MREDSCCSDCMKPDFLIIPKIVHSCEDLQPADWIVYATVYWFEHMRDGKCTAGNEAIANVANVGERAVRGSLERLERHGFIRREYRDKKRKDRAQIVSLVRYGIQEAVTDEKTIPLSGMKALEVKVPTPGEYARKFFEGDRDVIGELGKALEDAGIPQDFVVREMLKFKNYWTEPTKSGRKQRWELQPTFDIKRRLGMWFRNAAERQSGSRRSSGAGTVV